MRYEPISLPDDLEAARKVAEAAFSSTPDSSLEEWFSFSEMESAIHTGQGMCIKATDEQHEMVGVMYAQQENPVNGREGLEKWMILLAAVTPDATNTGIGSGLLQEIEREAKKQGAIKMFVYTNQNDERVIHFYEKNGYQQAGSIRDYQYGTGNAAVFLLKYI